FLTNQIEKLWDIRSVEVMKIRNDELPNNNLQQHVSA
ncbi:acetolactate synthase 2 small subunit, partial [Vibrio fluvialis]|nr:acetolactate synthase 2 small subunit [Vibrio fluvialis]